jgi:hypothetical protein
MRMKMDHALRLAAGQAARPDDILSVAGRLAGQGLRASFHALPATPPSRAPAIGPGNLATLHACQSLLSQTVALLE